MPDRNDAVGVFRSSDAERILRAVQMLESAGLLDPGVIRALIDATGNLDIETITVKNVSGQTIPPYACMQATGTFEEGENVLEVDQPQDSDGSAGFYVFNNHVEIAADELGDAQRGHANIRGTYDGAALTAGDRFRPEPGSWEVVADTGGPFIAVGPDDIGDDLGLNVIKLSLEGQGGGGGKILAEIVSVALAGSSSPFNGLKIATSTVICCPVGETSLIGTSVEIVDHAECLLNEDNAALVGRKIWAFRGDAKDRSVGAGPDDYAGEHWVNDGLCCPDTTTSNWQLWAGS